MGRRVGGVDDVAHGVHGGHRAHLQRAKLEGACAEAGFHAALGSAELADGGAGAGSHAALGERQARGGDEGLAHRHRAVEARGAGLRIAECKVEQAARTHDGDAPDAHVKADAAPLEFGRGAGRGIETEGRSAAEYDGVDFLDGVLRSEQVRLARRRRRAADINAADGAFGRDDRRASGTARAVREVPELKSGNLGDGDGGERGHRVSYPFAEAYDT